MGTAGAEISGRVPSSQRDRDTKYAQNIDEVFAGVGGAIPKRPYRCGCRKRHPAPSTWTFDGEVMTMKMERGALLPIYRLCPEGSK
jgi:hypothetical protein